MRLCIDFLVATDILSRGIDIDDIRLVINYDVPRDCDDYIHRVGRTARAGNEGRAVTFVSEEDQIFFKRIEDFIGQDIEKLQLPKELGEAPQYNPQKKEVMKKSGKNKKRYNSNSKKPHDKRRNTDKDKDGKVYNRKRPAKNTSKKQR